MTPPPLLALTSIVKRFGGVTALDGVSLALEAGEIHALVGENGAGKSTLVKILSGALRPDAGSIAVDGATVLYNSPAAAIAAGIGLIPQEAHLVPAMTVAENVALGAEPLRGRSRFLDRAAMERTAREAVGALGASIDPGALAGTLAPAERQIVEIARAVSRHARILALDEPTAALSRRETEALFGRLRRMREAGAGILYISHRLEDVFEIADRISILRDGKLVATEIAGSLDRPAMIALMVGRAVEERPARAGGPAGAEILRIEGLRTARLRGIDLTVRRGEILGLGGLAGAGRTELARAVFGADSRTAGRIVLEGTEVAPRTPREALDLGIGLITEDRDRLGLVSAMSLRENVSLSGLRRLCRGPFILREAEKAAVAGHVERLRIKARSIDAPVRELSGGNRQKALLARTLETKPRLYLFDEPTAGVDVGARAEIHAIIARLAEDGCGVVVISSDLEELLALSDRIVVLREGRVAGETVRAETTPERIMELATA